MYMVLHRFSFDEIHYLS